MFPFKKKKKANGKQYIEVKEGQGKQPRSEYILCDINISRSTRKNIAFNVALFLFFFFFYAILKYTGLEMFGSRKLAKAINSFEMLNFISCIYTFQAVNSLAPAVVSPSNVKGISSKMLKCCECIHENVLIRETLN